METMKKQEADLSTADAKGEKIISYLAGGDFQNDSDDDDMDSDDLSDEEDLSGEEDDEEEDNENDARSDDDADEDEDAEGEEIDDGQDIETESLEKTVIHGKDDPTEAEKVNLS